MAAVGSANTKPELQIRRALHRAGFRYRLHSKKLPGKPDLVFPKYKAVVFVHGCFWHGHDCHLFKTPKTRPEFWVPKIESNKGRDAAAYTALKAGGWRVAEVWECSLKSKRRLDFTKLIEAVSEWLRGKQQNLTIAGS